jgi:hypothetical protein
MKSGSAGFLSTILLSGSSSRVQGRSVGIAGVAVTEFASLFQVASREVIPGYYY